MDSTFYVTVYDAAAVPAFDPGFTILPALVLGVACALLVGHRRGWIDVAGRAGELLIFCWIAVLGAPLIFVTGLLVADGTRVIQQALASGRYDRVAGRIESFEPGDAGGHQDESFSVTTAGKVYRYRYNQSNVVRGFHESAGPLRAGMTVRIADVRGTIARLQVLQGPGEPRLPHRYRRYDIPHRDTETQRTPR